jgi:hypothetical protein
MAYLAVNKDGKEKIFRNRPFREKEEWIDDTGHNDSNWYSFVPDTGITIPYGSIIAMTGQKITFEDEPIEI